MKIEIYFLNSKLTTEIDKDIKVSELLYDLKNYFKMKDVNFVLFDSNKKQLNDNDIIQSKKNTLLSFYLIKSNLHLIPKKENTEKINANMGINELIMKCTGAKKMLEKKNALPNAQNRLNIIDIFGGNNGDGGENGSAFERLINLFQIMEEGNGGLRPIIRRNNGPVEADEKALRELQDMGFPEDRARQALINSRNDINRATEILLGEMGD